MTRFLILSMFAVTFFSCQNQRKFDKERWAEVADLMTFPNRKSMLDDLTKNVPLKGKTFQDMILLLGQTQYPIDSTLAIGYKIDESYGSDIDPILTQNLFFHFDKDFTVTSFNVQEWRK